MNTLRNLLDSLKQLPMLNRQRAGDDSDTALAVADEETPNRPLKSRAFLSPADDPEPFDEDTPESSSPYLLEADHIGVNLGHQWILQDVTLAIPRGQTLAIIGESGCGKTVLMKTLIGLVTPTYGKILFDGNNLAKLNYKQLTEIRRRIGFVFQNAALFDSMTIFQNVAFPLRQQPDHLNDMDIVDQVMERLADVGLPFEVAKKRPAELSGGMRKRVGLARALILKPELVLYDEPTTGLDPIMSDVINELILATRRKYPVTSVVVTHDMRTARKVADRVVMLFPRRRLDEDASQMLYDGPPSGLENADDRRVRQFVRGEAGERLNEMRMESDDGQD